MDEAGVVALIEGVPKALSELGGMAWEKVGPKPAVPIARSVERDFLVCLKESKKLKVLKRYLRNNLEMTPTEYRVKWGLPSDHPMAAPADANMRRGMVKKVSPGKGLNQKRWRPKMI